MPATGSDSIEINVRASELNHEMSRSQINDFNPPLPGSLKAQIKNAQEFEILKNEYEKQLHTIITLYHTYRAKLLEEQMEIQDRLDKEHEKDIQLKLPQPPNKELTQNDIEQDKKELEKLKTECMKQIKLLDKQINKLTEEIDDIKIRVATSEKNIQEIDGQLLGKLDEFKREFPQILTNQLDLVFQDNTIPNIEQKVETTESRTSPPPSDDNVLPVDTNQNTQVDQPPIAPPPPPEPTVALSAGEQKQQILENVKKYRDQLDMKPETFDDDVQKLKKVFVQMIVDSGRTLTSDQRGQIHQVIHDAFEKKGVLGLVDQRIREQGQLKQLNAALETHTKALDGCRNQKGKWMQMMDRIKEQELELKGMTPKSEEARRFRK